jgi:hypothetical protein
MDYLENSWLAKLTTETVWGFPINEIVHILSASVVVGIAVLFVANSLTTPRIEASLLRRYSAPLFVVSFIVALASGIVFFAAWPDRYLTNLAFGFKIPLVIAIAILSVFIWRGSKSAETSGKNTVLVWASLVLSLSAIVAGRLMAYV